MGLFDKFKKKTSKLADEHGDQAEGAIDKAAEFIDDKTGGKHTEKIEDGAEKAKDFLGNLTDDK